MSIAILGGSFNPAHTDHILLCKYIQNILKADKFLLIPNASPPHKNTCTVNFNDRVNMLSLMLEKDSVFEICDIEKDSQIRHYSFDTIKELSGIYKDETIYFCMGMDSLNYLDKWHRGLELTTMCNLVVTGRRGVSIKDANPKVQEYLKDHGVFEGDDGFEMELAAKYGKCFVLKKEFNSISSSILRAEFEQFYKKYTSFNELFANKEQFPHICTYLREDVVRYILEKGLYR